MVGTWIAFILATLVIIFHLVLLVAYAVLIGKKEHLKAEKVITLSGLALIVTMIFSFILVSFGYQNDIIELELTYSGAYAGFIALAFIPLLVIFDYKQNKWIKSLNKNELKEYGISKEFRGFFIYIVIALVALNFIIYGINAEAFVFEITGFLGL